MAKELIKMTSKFVLWRVKNYYIVTSHSVEVFRGGLEDAEHFITAHPYGLTKIEALNYTAERGAI